MNSQERSAWLAAKVAMACTALTVGVQILSYFVAVRDKHKAELMEHRREVLEKALDVVDHVYANVSFSGHPASNPHQWDISLARSAMNWIIIYCKDPNKVLAAFGKATGTYNPDTQIPSTFGPKGLEELRDAICDELEVPSVRYTDSNFVWISSLPGGK